MNKLKIGKSKIVGAGMGVFAGGNFKIWEVIETCPAIVMTKEDTDKLNETELVNYLFYCGKKLEQSIIVLGYGSLYNHANLANAKYTIKLRQKTVEIVAIKTINRGEEIFINYNGGKSKSDRPLWFEVK